METLKKMWSKVKELANKVKGFVAGVWMSDTGKVAVVVAVVVACVLVVVLVVCLATSC